MGKMNNPVTADKALAGGKYRKDNDTNRREEVSL